MTLKERYSRVLEYFAAEMPSPQTELHFADNFQLLVAVVLSAQCTDKRINLITPALFAAYPTAADMAAATEEEIFSYIRSVSYPNNKARNLLGAARAIVDNFDGEVPADIDSLLTIPGVGRKTANVILSVAFGQSTMAVDTHVFRVSNRIGLTNDSRTPLETERTLVRHIPADLIPRAHHWLILHGRYVCKARRPLCLDCGLRSVCRYYLQSGKTKTNA